MYILREKNNNKGIVQNSIFCETVQLREFSFIPECYTKKQRTFKVQVYSLYILFSNFMVWCKIIKENHGEPKLFLNVRRLLYIRFYITFKKAVHKLEGLEIYITCVFLSVTVKIFIVTIHRIENITCRLKLQFQSWFSIHFINTLFM